MMLAVSESVTAVWDRLASDVFATDIASVPLVAPIELAVEIGGVMGVTGGALETVVMV